VPQDREVDLQVLFDRLYVIDRALLSHLRYLSDYHSHPSDAIRSIMFEANEIFDEYLAEDEELVSGNNGLFSFVRRFIESASKSYYDYLTSLATATLLKMVGDAYIISNNNVEKSLRALISQMARKCTYVSKPSNLLISFGMSDNNFGDGVVYATLDSKDNPGQLCENAFDEKIVISVTRSGTPQRPAVMRLVGQASVSKWSMLWPLGSGTDMEYTAILPSSPENVLNNADFSRVVIESSGGNQGTEEGSEGEGEGEGEGGGEGSSGGGSQNTVKIVGWDVVGNVDVADGVLRVSSNDSFVTLSQQVSYKYNEAFFVGAFVKRVGQLNMEEESNHLEIALVEDVSASGDNGYILDSNDMPIRIVVPYDNNKITDDRYVLLGSIVYTSYKQYSRYVFRIRFGPMGEDGSLLCRAVYFAKATQLYKGGPHFVILQGTKPFIIGDTGYIEVYNSGSKWQRVFERFFSMTSRYGLLLPSSDIPIIED